MSMDGEDIMTIPAEPR